MLVLLAVSGIYYVGWTETGLQHLVALASRRLGPVTLTLRGARGTLYKGIHLDHVEVAHQRVRIVAESVDGRVALLPLLWQTIRVTDADLGTVTIQVLPNTVQGGTPWTPRFLVGLLNIQAQQVKVAHAQLITPGGTTLAADQVQASGQVGAHEIRIFDSTLRYAGFEVRSAGSVLAAEPIGLRGHVRFSLNLPDQPAWLANGQFDGNLDQLAISGALLAPFNADFHGAALALTGNWHWQGKSLVRTLDLRAWGAGNALGLISGTLALSGDHSGFRAVGALDPPALKSGPLAVDFAGNYGARVLEVAHVSFTHRASGAQLAGSGHLDFQAGEPRLDLAGQWRAIRWPLTDSTAALHSTQGTYTLTGQRPYALTANGALQIQSEPSFQFRAAGRLAHDGLTISSATVDAYGGQAQVRAEVKWSPKEIWSASGTMQGLKVESVRPGIFGRLNFLLDAEGQGFGQAGALQAQMSQLSGTVRGQRASGSAGVALAADGWLLRKVRLQLGGTRVEADGHLGAHPDVQFAIDAADLALLSTAAHGQLKTSGRLRDDENSPLLQARVSGSNLDYAGITLHRIDGNFDFDPNGSGHAESKLLFERLVVANHTVERALVSTTGSAASHQFTLNVAAPPFAIRGGGGGTFSKGMWRGQLNAFETTDGADLRLALASPAALAIAFNGAELRVDRLCLRDTLATLCAAAERLLGHTQVSVSAANVPLRAFTAGLTSDTDFDGRISLEARGEAGVTSAWSGDFSGILADAGLRHRLRSGRVEPFSLGNGKVDGALDAQGLKVRVALDAGAAGSISGRLSARSSDASWRAWPLAGELQVQTQALGFIDSYVAQVDRVSGQLDANLTLAGTLSALSFNGDLKVSKAEVDAYQFNLALRNLNFEARLRATTLQLEGNATAGADGKAHFDGVIDWRKALPYGQLNLIGDNLHVVNLPEARIQISPDVHIKFSGRRLDITGTIALPYARLQSADQFANAVRKSNDEVLISAGQQPPSATFHVFSDVTLRLGERVTIDTLGLAGRLSGNLRAVTDDTGLSRGTGEVQVEEGKYTAYGRRLDIEHGRLLFNSGPMDDPAIDLRAIKRFPDITAGVNVRGTLRDPRLTLFSDPAVAQSQIVSLLLAGGSLETVQGTADSTQRANAARNNLLAQSSALLIQRYGHKVGIDDVSVESDLNNDTSLVFGRYLSPRLYISYGIGLAELINTYKLRYTIGDHWTVKTEAGAARSADLVYTVER